MRTVWLTVLLLAAMPAMAQKWVDVEESASAVHYIDPGTIEVNGHMRRVWALTDLRERGRSGEISRLVFYEFDCKERRNRILSISVHSDRMAGGRTIVSSSEHRAWDYIPPRTVAATVLEIVCAARQ